LIGTTFEIVLLAHVRMEKVKNEADRVLNLETFVHAIKKKDKIKKKKKKLYFSWQSLGLSAHS